MGMDYTFESLHYNQGSRDMFVVIGDFQSAAKLVAKPSEWNPASPEGNSNRPQDKQHRAGIRDYLITEADPIIGSLTFYLDPNDAKWRNADGFDNVAYLQVRMGAKVECNDGQHRLGGGSDVMTMEDALDSDTYRRVADMGLPLIFVLEGKAYKKAQDYGDLQVNVKPPTGSLGMSMNRRVPFNRFVLDITLNQSIGLFSTGKEPGDRIDFVKDTPGKKSAHWTSYKTLHYMLSVLLAGSALRSKPAMTKALNGMVAADADACREGVAAFLNGFAKTNQYAADLVAGATTMEIVRTDSYLTSAGTLYAIAHAAHEMIAGGNSPAKVGEWLGALDYDRTGSLLKGTLVTDHKDANGKVVSKIGSGRDAWMGAGDALVLAVQASGALTTGTPGVTVKKVTRRATKAA